MIDNSPQKKSDYSTNCADLGFSQYDFMGDFSAPNFSEIKQDFLNSLENNGFNNPNTILKGCEYLRSCLNEHRDVDNVINLMLGLRNSNIIDLNKLPPDVYFAIKSELLNTMIEAQSKGFEQFNNKYSIRDLAEGYFSDLKNTILLNKLEDSQLLKACRDAMNAAIVLANNGIITDQIKNDTNFFFNALLASEKINSNYYYASFLAIVGDYQEARIKINQASLYLSNATKIQLNLAEPFIRMKLLKETVRLDLLEAREAHGNDRQDLIQSAEKYIFDIINDIKALDPEAKIEHLSKDLRKMFLEANYYLASSYKMLGKDQVASQIVSNSGLLRSELRELAIQLVSSK